MSLIATVWTLPRHQRRQNTREGAAGKASSIPGFWAGLLLICCVMPHNVLLCLWAPAFFCDRSVYFPLGCPEALMSMLVRPEGQTVDHDEHLKVKLLLRLLIHKDSAIAQSIPMEWQKWSFTAWLTGQNGVWEIPLFLLYGTVTWAGLCRSMPHPQSWGGASHRVKGEGKTDYSSLKNIKAFIWWVRH